MTQWIPETGDNNLIAVMVMALTGAALLLIIMGTTIRKGLHQGAQKSSRTSLPLVKISPESYSYRC